MAWFRVDAGVGAHPKMALLAERIGSSRRDALGLVVLLWEWTLTYCRSGRIRAEYVASLPRVLDVPADDGERVIEALVEAGFLDRDGASLIVHGFDARNGRQLREGERKRRSRERAAKAKGAKE